MLAQYYPPLFMTIYAAVTGIVSYIPSVTVSHRNSHENTQQVENASLLYTKNFNYLNVLNARLCTKVKIVTSIMLPFTEKSELKGHNLIAT